VVSMPAVIPILNFPIGINSGGINIEIYISGFSFICS
jgi:hypothetical protein